MLTSPNTQTIRERAVRLFSYLRELALLNTTVIRDYADFEEVLWFDELPDHDAINSIARGTFDDAGETWLEIKRLPEPQLPPPPKAVSGWIDLTRLHDSLLEPTLRSDLIVSSDTETGVVTTPLTDHPEVVEVWHRYAAEKWRPWSATHREWQLVQQKYEKLFKIHQQLQKLGEAYEFMLSTGLLMWKTPSGPAVRRHLLTGQAEISFQPERGILSVGPGADGVRLHLEQEMLELSDRPSPESETELSREISAVAESPWDVPAIHRILKSWVHVVNARGEFAESSEADVRAGEFPYIVPRPALILRKRSTRGVVAAFEKILKDLQSPAAVIPEEVRRLCAIEDTPASNGEDSGAEAGKGEIPQDIYFPLPANEEQLQIAVRARRESGVLVQGPPGTGKSHTIANLICDLLASGKRVLVTSQTPRALRVLKDKIPSEISPLAVVVLGNDAKGLGELEDSVRGITDRFVNWNESAGARRIAELERQIRDVRETRARTQSRIRDLREAETRRYSAAVGFEGTAMEIAEKVREAAPRFAWLNDSRRDGSALAVTAASMKEALAALREFSSDATGWLLRPTLDSTRLLDPHRFATTVATLSDCEQKFAQRTEEGLVEESLFSLAPEGCTAIAGHLQQFLTAKANLCSGTAEWVAKAVSEILSDRALPWCQLFEDTQAAIEGLAHRATAVQHNEITLPPGADLLTAKADATDLLDHLRAGHSLGWWVFKATVVKRADALLESGRVDGRRLDTVTALEKFVKTAETIVATNRASSLWRDIFQPARITLPRQVREIEEHHATLNSALALAETQKLLRQRLDEAGIAHPVWTDEQSVSLLIEKLLSVVIRDQKVCVVREYSEYLTWLETEAADPRKHPIAAQILSAAQERSVAAYVSAIAAFDEVRKNSEAVRRREKTLTEAQSQLPKLVTAMRERPEVAQWDAAIDELVTAWEWAGASFWLDTYLAQHDVIELQRTLTLAEARIADLTARIAAEKAWDYCFKRMSEEQRQHLVAWSKVVKQIGKGTGKYAPLRRKQAQEHMEKCRGAIPAWIMPFYRVAETISPQPDQFDVVIVDEASQSGPDALLLTYIAKQMIIVGDDQQIAPEYVGTNLDTVNQLIERYLYDFDLRNTFGLGFSLFAHGEIKYGNRIVLREHFRCMPEIIRFSNDLCYRSTPLVPLRQYAADRIEPLVPVYVEGGYRDGSSANTINRPEAEAIVNQIVACSTDPRYEGKTFGVISLQGETQAQLIERELIRALPPQQFESRRIVCGDAYAFQGDERDVMFMSLVAAPNIRIGALTKETDKRRFNVAASRARDQMWLFHTAKEEDLNPEDMRSRLLHHVYHPNAIKYAEPDFSLCESKFERDTATRIHARGFRIYLQYEPFGTGGYRIDVVVEGARGRLAVECDGDYWHGADKWDADMVRQRQLERCGWVFWRLLGSEFNADPDGSMAHLWRKLEDMGILPGAATPPEPSPGTPHEPEPAPRPKEPTLGHPEEPLPSRPAEPSGVFPRVIPAHSVLRVPIAMEPPVDGDGDGRERRRAGWGRQEPDATSHDEEVLDDEESKDDRGSEDDEDIQEELLGLYFEGQTRTIDSVTNAEIRSAMDAILNVRRSVAREEFLSLVCSSLGFKRLGRKIRKKINIAIGAEIRARRLINDWNVIQRP